MKRTTRKLLNGILTVVLICSAGMMLRQALDKSQGTEAYDEALQVAISNQETLAPDTMEETVPQTTAAPEKEIVWTPEQVEDDPVMEELEEVDLGALRQVNSDVIGWIRIPDTKVDYPVMQGEDNDYYLNHTWEKNKNYVGSIFMEYQNDPGMGDYNTLIYGHNMKNGSMFAQLHRYGTQEFYEKHPYVYLVTDSGILRYEIFSSYRTSVDGEAYNLSFQQSDTREDFLSMAKEKSAIDTGIEPGIRDRILTLSTCSGAGHTTRWVVHARLKMVKTEL